MKARGVMLGWCLSGTDLTLGDARGSASPTLVPDSLIRKFRELVAQGLVIPERFYFVI